MAAHHASTILSLFGRELATFGYRGRALEWRSLLVIAEFVNGLIKWRKKYRGIGHLKDLFFSSARPLSRCRKKPEGKNAA